MYYKKKYIKYKLKYLNLVGGEPKEQEEIDLKKCHPIILSKKIIGELLSKPYTIENYNLILAKFQEITNPSVDTKLNENNNSKKCVNIEKENKKEKIKYLLLEELVTILINLHEYINIFSLPPFNLLEKVESIRTLINPNSLEYTEDNIQIFLERLLGIIIPSLCNALEELCKILFSEKFDDINMVNLKDSIFLSLRLQSTLNEEGIFADFDNILANVLIQTLTKLDLLINKEFPKVFGKNKDTLIIIANTNLIINELVREKEVRIKIKPLLNKIQQLLQRCNLSKTDFQNKFVNFINNLKKLDGLKENKDNLIKLFLELLGIIKGKLPTTKCVNFYGMDNVSKYNFYDLLKKIGDVLVDLDNTYKKEIEKKIVEIKPFLSTSDRALSFFRKLKSTVKSTEPSEKQEDKIKRLIDELNNLINNCIPKESNFFNNFSTFIKNLEPSNIKQVDVKNFDEVWESVARLDKDSYTCSKHNSLKKDKLSKKELYTKLKGIGKLLLSNISEF